MPAIQPDKLEFDPYILCTRDQGEARCTNNHMIRRAALELPAPNCSQAPASTVILRAYLHFRLLVRRGPCFFVSWSISGRWPGNAISAAPQRLAASPSPLSPPPSSSS